LRLASITDGKIPSPGQAYNYARSATQLYLCIGTIYRPMAYPPSRLSLTKSSRFGCLRTSRGPETNILPQARSACAPRPMCRLGLSEGGRRE
jgi:hypothetical protein